MFRLPSVDSQLERTDIAAIAKWRPGCCKKSDEWCPGNNESAGKKKAGRTPPGNRWLRQVLVQSEWGASRSKNLLKERYEYVDPSIWEPTIWISWTPTADPLIPKGKSPYFAALHGNRRANASEAT
jgi:hypothetical protein